MSLIKKIYQRKKTNAFFSSLFFLFILCVFLFVSVKKMPIRYCHFAVVVVLLVVFFICLVSFLPIIIFNFESRCSMARTHSLQNQEIMLFVCL